MKNYLRQSDGSSDPSGQSGLPSHTQSEEIHVWGTSVGVTDEKHANWSTPHDGVESTRTEWKTKLLFISIVYVYKNFWLA